VKVRQNCFHLAFCKLLITLRYQFDII
jgi:hypothetical protein